MNDEKFKKELKAAEELPKPENTAPSVTYLAGTVYFNNGSSAVDASYNRQLREIVRLAKAKKATLNVFGYASSRTRNTDIVSHKMANFRVRPRAPRTLPTRCAAPECPRRKSRSRLCRIQIRLISKSCLKASA